MKANMGPTGICTVTYNLPEGGPIQKAEQYWGYKTPYQQVFGGRLCKFAKASTYDTSVATANDYIVVVPCGTRGELPDGFTYMTTRRMDLLEGASAAYYPLDAYVAVNGYATSESQFAEVTLVPLIPGSTASVPVSGGATILLDADITTDANGFATNAFATSYIIGTAITPADNSSGADGAKFITVIFSNPTEKTA